MNSGGEDGPGRAQEGTTNGSNGNISTESAVAALEQHDTLFHRQVMHLRQQQVIQLSVKATSLSCTSSVVGGFTESHG